MKYGSLAANPQGFLAVLAFRICLGRKRHSSSFFDNWNAILVLLAGEDLCETQPLA